MAFWKKFYKSRYTGAEIDAAVAKAGDATKVTANPSLAGTESALTGLEVGTTKYKVEQPINVVADPTLAGSEVALEGLQVGNTKYKVVTIPTIEITQEEFASILTELAIDLNSATNNFQYKVYTINDASIAGSIGAKIASAYNRGPFANLSVYGLGTIGCYITGTNYYYSPISYYNMSAIQKSLAFGMTTSISENSVFVRVIFALATEVTP